MIYRVSFLLHEIMCVINTGDKMIRDKQETQTYVALIGDVINSKDILNRQLFQEDLQNTFDQLNQRFQKKYCF